MPKTLNRVGTLTIINLSCMKNTSFFLPAAGFIIALSCALAPRTTLPAPYYGIDPDTNTCALGTLEGTCGTGTTIRCTVYIGDYTGIPAWDNKTGNICSVQVFKSTITDDPDKMIAQ